MSLSTSSTPSPNRFSTLATPGDVSEFCALRLDGTRAGLETVLTAKTARTIDATLVPFDRLNVELDAAGNIAGLLRSVHPDEAVRKAAEDCEQQISAFATDLALNREVYDALAAVESAAKSADQPTRHLLKKMKAASDFGKGLQVRHQMYYAKLSVELYSQATPVDSTALSKKLMNHYSPFAYVEGTAFEASFGHLDGYSAIYYTYMWSLVIAKDLFSEFKKKGLLDPAVSGRYRKFVLAPGGSKDANLLVEEFLGRPVDFGSYEAWLNEG